MCHILVTNVQDLSAGQALDYDPETYELQRLVQTKCAAIRRRRQQRFKEEEQLRQQEVGQERGKPGSAGVWKGLERGNQGL